MRGWFGALQSYPYSSSGHAACQYPESHTGKECGNIGGVQALTDSLIALLAMTGTWAANVGVQAMNSAIMEL